MTEIQITDEERIKYGWVPSEPDDCGCILWLNDKSPFAIVTDSINRTFACPVLQMNDLLADMRELNKQFKQKKPKKT